MLIEAGSREEAAGAAAESYVDVHLGTYGETKHASASYEHIEWRSSDVGADRLSVKGLSSTCWLALAMMKAMVLN